MRPVTLAAFALLIALAPVNASAQTARGTFDGNFDCSRDILRTEVMHVAAPGTLKLREFSAARRASSIQLIRSEEHTSELQSH